MKTLHLICIVAIVALAIYFFSGCKEKYQWTNPPSQPYTQDCAYGIICQGKVETGGDMLGRLQVRECIRGGSNSDNPNGWYFGAAMSCTDPGTGPIGKFKSCTDLDPMTNYCDDMPLCSDVGKQCGLSNISNA